MRRNLTVGVALIVFGFLAVFLAFPVPPIGNILGLFGVFVAFGGFLLATLGGILATTNAADARDRVGQKLGIAVFGPIIPSAVVILYLQFAGFDFPLLQISATLALVGMVGGIRVLSQTIVSS